jgi:hypothetical protein
MATIRRLDSAKGGGGSVAVATEQPWQESDMLLCLSNSQNQLAGGFPPQGDLRAVYAKNSRIAARRHVRPGDRVPREKAHLHQPPGIVFRKIDTLDDSVLPAPQLCEIARDVIAHRFALAGPSFLPSDTRLHLEPLPDS